MKKNLRYYLLIATLMAVASVSAQVFAQEPQASMSSTSSMVGSGSTLPSAAAEGVYTSYGEEENTQSSRVIKKLPPKPNDPLADPIGDGVMVMLALASLYATRRRKNL